LGFNKTFTGLANRTIEIQRTTITPPGTKEVIADEGFDIPGANSRMGSIIVEYDFSLPSAIEESKKAILQRIFDKYTL
jgi:DnaJ-class molecular chaperone